MFNVNFEVNIDDDSLRTTNGIKYKYKKIMIQQMQPKENFENEDK